MNRIIALLVALAMVWLGLGIYLSVTAGTAVSENGEQVWYLNRFDRIWTEVIVLFVAALVWGGVYGYRMMTDITKMTAEGPEQMGTQLTRLYHYGMFALYGVYVSVGFNLSWYSLIRRVRGGNLWSDSFLHYVCTMFNNSLRFIFRHKNSVISTLLPYNVFLFSNLAGIVIVYMLREQTVRMLLLLLIMAAVDGIVGVLIFRRNAEQTEIVEGIQRIRDGEVGGDKLRPHPEILAQRSETGAAGVGRIVYELSVSKQLSQFLFKCVYD